MFLLGGGVLVKYILAELSIIPILTLRTIPLCVSIPFIPFIRTPLCNSPIHTLTSHYLWITIPPFTSLRFDPSY